MNLELTDEQRALRDTVRRFLAEQASVADYVRPALAEPASARVWEGLAQLGATGVLVPTEFGGTGMSMVDAVIVAEEIGGALLPDPWLSSAVAAVRAIRRFGAESDAEGLLEEIADGSRVAAVGPLGQATGQTVTSSADHLLTGALGVVAAAGRADVLLTVIPDGDELALYAVETSAPGVALRPLRGIDPTRDDVDVRLDGIAGRLLARADRSVLSGLIDDVLVASAADALGAASRLLDMVIDYAKTRVQFGQPIGSFQAVAHLCVDMFETVELARSGVLHAAWAADEADPDEFHLAAIRLKGFAARLATVGDTAIQVFGGIGFTWEHDAHLYLKRLLSWSSLLGGSDRYLAEVGERFVRAANDGRAWGSS